MLVYCVRAFTTVFFGKVTMLNSTVVKHRVDTCAHAKLGMISPNYSGESRIHSKRGGGQIFSIFCLILSQLFNISLRSVKTENIIASEAKWSCLRKPRELLLQLLGTQK